MLKFKTIREFINFKRICPFCQVPLGVKIHTWKFKTSDISTVQDRGWLVLYHKNQQKDLPIFAININTNKVSALEKTNPAQITQQCFFKIKCYCKNPMCFKEDNNAYHYLSDTLFFEEKGKKIYDFFLWKEKLVLSKDYSNIIESNYQSGKSFLTVQKWSESGRYKEQMLFLELPLINLHELQSLEDIETQIKLCTMFS